MIERFVIELRPNKRYPLFVMNETASLKFMLTLPSLKYRTYFIIHKNFCQIFVYLMFDLCSFRTNVRLVLKLIKIKVFHTRTYSIDVMCETEIVSLNNPQTSHRTHRTSINNLFFIGVFNYALSSRIIS
jgi:hypothetical protein